MTQGSDCNLVSLYLLQFRMTEFGTLEIVTETETREQEEVQEQPVSTSTSQAPTDAQKSLSSSQAQCQGQPAGQHHSHLFVALTSFLKDSRIFVTYIQVMDVA